MNLRFLEWMMGYQTGWAQIVNGEIDVSNSYTTNIIYAECEPNTTYHVGPAPGYILTFNIGWTKTTPADGVSVYGYTDRESDSSRKTITTGSDAEYLFVEMAYGATSAYVKVEKENDIGFEVMWTDYLSAQTYAPGAGTNIITYPFTDTTKTDSLNEGLTYTDNEDGTVTIDGVADNKPGGFTVCTGLELQPGNYRLKGVGANNTVNVCLSGGGKSWSAYADDIIVTITSTSTCSICIYLGEGTYDNFVVTPYLEDAGERYAQLSYKAVGTVGSELTGVHPRNGDGTLGDALVQSDLGIPVVRGNFYYDEENDRIYFNPNDIADGGEVVAFYNRRVHADQLINYSDFFSGKATLYIDALAEDKCANIYRVQFFIPKADFNGEFTFDMGDNQTIHNFEAEALAGACGTEGQLWTYTVFGVDTEDA